MRELSFKLEELRKKYLFIAIPAYGGLVNINFFHSMLRLQRLLMEHAIPHSFQCMGNESLITRGRNRLAKMFLDSPGTHLLFVDADIEFDPLDVLALAHFDKGVIGAAYPLKSINWDHAKKALKRNPEATGEELQIACAKWSAHFDPEQKELAVSASLEPIEVDELGTGFMLIAREVFEKLQVPNYRDAQVGDVVGDYFQVGIHENRYESEDYSFCRKWRELGEKIFLCPWMTLKHQGTYSFAGNMLQALQSLGEAY